MIGMRQKFSTSSFLFHHQPLKLTSRMREDNFLTKTKAVKTLLLMMTQKGGNRNDLSFSSGRSILVVE